MVVSDQVEIGDYVRFERTIGPSDHPATHYGSGYITKDLGDMWGIMCGDLYLEAYKLRCTMRMKQYRLEV